ncbi:hypothetical protein [Amycolatopsis benzoatilytica]|uniref:hypothetical protein n=1 Tax=Amycolatopsis benzoatilytica TaxID=346045 RepID=UPI00036AD54E|nr:hypothetical protein [Amycolatopsis benzoatilytica]
MDGEEAGLIRGRLLYYRRVADREVIRIVVVEHRVRRVLRGPLGDRRTELAGSLGTG